MVGKAPPTQCRRLDFDDRARRIRFQQAPRLPDGGTVPDGRPSPDYVQTDESVWNQGMLAKVLLQMKDSEVWKLKFPENCYKPYEYDRWIMAVNRILTGFSS